MHFALLAQMGKSFPHTLLWRISGKGLQKPSYLYGTMHLNDKRLFLFGDSLYHAIESSEGLAIEVNPDEMGAYFVNQLFDQLENGKKLQDLVGKEYFASHKKALAKKFGKPAEDIKAADVVKEKNKWMGEYFRKGEMPTFMDAYLYNIAKRQGKWSGGIEDLEDQTGLMSDLVDQSDVNYLLHSDESAKSEGNSGVEKMVRLYTAQDLEGIQNFTDDESTPEQKDKLLLRRNVKMARRIDSLSAIRSMVFAVGCAHLPGDSGVIDLLRRRGFVVEPVYSSKKIASSDYTFKEVHLPWISITDAQGAYTAEMPSNPATVHLYGLIEMKFLMDLFNMSGFGTMAVLNPGRSGSKDSLFKNMASQMFHGEVPSGKDLLKNGVHGKEYIYYGSEANVRLQLFADSHRIYMAVMSALKKEVLLSADAEKFFRSYTITGIAPPSAPTSSTTFTDSVLGVSFVSPINLAYNEKLSKSADESLKATTYTGMDVKTGAYIMLLTKALKPGYHFANLQATYKDMEKLFYTQYDHIQRDSIFLDSIKLVHFTGQNIKRPEIFISAVVAIRDGRQIMLMVITDSASRNSTSLLEPIRSLRLIPHAPIRWENYESPERLFSFYGPSPAITKSNKTNQWWVSYDSATATSYMVIPDTLDKYAWYTSDSAIWRTKLNGDTAKGALLEIRDIANSAVPGKEYILQSKGNPRALIRTRLLAAGNTIIKLYAFGEPGQIRSPDADRFFETFRLLHPEPSVVTKNRTALLLNDLGSKDSLTVLKAYQALSKAPFRKKDAPLLREALFKHYKEPYSAVEGVIINNAIGRELAEVSDSATVDFVRESYSGLAKEHASWQHVALTLLMRQHSSYSYTLLAELLQRGPGKEKLEYSDVYALKGNLKLTAAIYPSLLVWASDSLHASAIANITLALEDSAYLSKDVLASSGETFINAARILLPNLVTKDQYNDYFLSHLIKLVGRLHTPAAWALLKDYQSVKNIYLLSLTMNQLLEGQQTLAAAALQRLAADPSYRLSLYDDLKKYQKTALYPKEFLSQAAFARSAIQNAAEEDDDDNEVGDISFLSKRTANYQGKSYIFYLYKVCYSGSEEPACHLGIAGGYDAAGTGLEPQKDLSGVHRQESFDGQKIEVLLKAYLKGLEE
jgi:uncharacterized protein YbaP (TraB family)